jgi:hypothetical protein
MLESADATLAAIPSPAASNHPSATEALDDGEGEEVTVIGSQEKGGAEEIAVGAPGTPHLPALEAVDVGEATLNGI